MKNLILSFVAITSLFLSLNAQANDTDTQTTSGQTVSKSGDTFSKKKNSSSDIIMTLAGTGMFIGAMEKVLGMAELPTILRATTHISALLYAAGRITQDDAWKERAVKFPLAVLTLTAVSSEIVQSGNKYIPFFGEALVQMPKESLVGLETLIIYIHGTDMAYQIYKKDIYKAMGWKSDEQVD